VAQKRILFVDNRPEFTHQPVLRLRMEGYEVDEATTKEEALKHLEEHDFDLLVFDAALPGQDGWKVLRELRQAPNPSPPKVLVFMAAKGETEQLKFVPVDAELRRPFRLEDFVAKVRDLLDGD
jgi:two-component system OmpR family response regulator